MTLIKNLYMLSAMDFGRVAQSVEHLTFNQVAPGSSPGTLTNKTPQNESFAGFVVARKQTCQTTGAIRPFSVFSG